ncbi:Innexin inx3, partial [Zootermopsis nevadensis]
IDNMVFRFHYRITTAILFVCSILCTANSLIGDPINCIADNSLPGHVINTYCWITSTFTLPHQQGKPVGTHVAHPGVGTYVEGENETRYHSYYQWIPFMLFFQEVIDNVIFRCHYRFTSAILFVCCILCTANSLIGNPIECLNSQFKDKIHVINTFCWITSTYTIPHLQGQQVGTHVAGPGVGPHVQGLDEVQHHNYYQWVPFVLFLQGLLFYVPHWLWKNWEGGKIKMISKDLRGSTIECKEKRHNKQDKLVQYISYSLHTHNGYAFGYFFCEILNFVNVVGNIFFIDKFLGNTFLSYGIKVIQMSSNDDLHRTDPMIAIFPRLTKCLFRTYGASGTIQTHDALCVLPLNILNEKIFIFLWFWFIILAALSGLALIYSIVIAMYPPIRETILIRLFKYRPPGGVDRIVTKIQV